jgi:large subunit ribosomal protein L24
MKKKDENKKMLHVKMGDRVQIIAGKEKGQTGIIKVVFKKQSKVLIEGINVRTKHIKPDPSNDMAKFKTSPFPIHVSNVCKYEE